MTRINGKRLIADLRRLAEFGQVGSGVNRVSFSSADLESRVWLCERMRAAGLDAATANFSGTDTARLGAARLCVFRAALARAATRLRTDGSTTPG